MCVLQLLQPYASLRAYASHLKYLRKIVQNFKFRSLSTYKAFFFNGEIWGREKAGHFKNTGRGGGQMVSMLAFYSDDPSSSPAEVNDFSCVKIELLE